MEFIRTEDRASVALVQLNRDVTNPIDLQLIQQLTETLRGKKDDSKVRSVVLCSSNNKFFSIGFNIPRLFELTPKEFQEFYQAFNHTCIELYTFPKPTVAAVTGHAIAGGCLLALCCDYRIIARGRKLMGLNEAKLGVPVPYPGDRILRDLVGARYAREISEFGEFYRPEDSVRMGMVDRVVPVADVIPKSIEKAKTIGELPHRAFQIIKSNRVEPVETQIQKHLKEKEQLFVDCWFSDETRQKLKDAMETF